MNRATWYNISSTTQWYFFLPMVVLFRANYWCNESFFLTARQCSFPIHSVYRNNSLAHSLFSLNYSYTSTVCILNTTIIEYVCSIHYMEAAKSRCRAKRETKGEKNDIIHSSNSMKTKAPDTYRKIISDNSSEYMRY